MVCLIVDDHPLTRDGTAVALRGLDAIADVQEAESLAQAREVLSQVAGISLVLLDLDLQDSRGIATLQSLKGWADERGLDARFVVLSGHCEPALVREVVDSLGTGFILKATPRDIFRQAVALTLAGGVFIPDVVLRELASHGSAASAATAPSTSTLALTRRECEVAALLVRGHTYKRIARELGQDGGKPISEHTVRAHVGNIAWKLGVTENAKAGVMAEIARRRLTFAIPPADEREPAIRVPS